VHAASVPAEAGAALAAALGKGSGSHGAASVRLVGALLPDLRAVSTQVRQLRPAAVAGARELAVAELDGLAEQWARKAAASAVRFAAQ